MRLLIVLCASIWSIASSAHAQEMSDEQRLNAAPFAAKPFQESPVPPLHYGALLLGPLVIEPSYSMTRTAESWRLPESGQNVTAYQARVQGYIRSHPLFRFGIEALLRSGKHSEMPDNHDPGALAARLGREPDEHSYKIDLVWLFGHLK